MFLKKRELHLCDQNAVKTIMKYYYNLKLLFSILIYSNM